jgi:hypothetical protein
LRKISCRKLLERRELSSSLIMDGVVMYVFFSSKPKLPNRCVKSCLVLIVQLQSVANVHFMLWSLILLADDFFNFISQVFFAISPCVNIIFTTMHALRPRGALVAVPYIGTLIYIRSLRLLAQDFLPTYTQFQN